MEQTQQQPFLDMKYTSFQNKNINGFPTRYGSILNPNSKQALLIISGNPGCCDMYGPLADQINAQTRGQFNIFVLGMFGSSLSTLEDCRQVFSQNTKSNKYQMLIHNQVQHKIDFIDHMLADYQQIYIGGHSVGGYCTTELLNHYRCLDGDSSGATSKYTSNNPQLASKIYKKFQTAFLLTPTIEKIGTSENGVKMLRDRDRGFGENYLIIAILKVLVFLRLTKLFAVFYTFLQYKTFNFSQHGHQFRDYMYKGYIQLGHPELVQNCLDLGIDEMISMGELPVHDLNAIEQDLGQNFFQVIYAQKDGWVNHYAPEQLRKNCPNICQETLTNISHGWCCVEEENRIIGNKIVSHLLR